MPWLCLGAPLSVVRWYDMVAFVWVTKYFHTILWRWYLYHSCIVWSGCQESDQTLQRTSVQCLHSIASTRVLVRVRVVTQQRSESEFKPDLQMSLWSFGHQLISIISINTLKLSLLRAYIQKAGAWSLSNILHLSQNFWLRTQNPLCVFEDCIANFITDMSKYCRKFPPIYSLLGYLVEYFKWNAGQQNGANRRLKSPPLQISVLKRKKKREIFSFFCISQSNMRWTHCLCLGKMRT